MLSNFHWHEAAFAFFLIGPKTTWLPLIVSTGIHVKPRGTQTGTWFGAVVVMPCNCVTCTGIREGADLSGIMVNQHKHSKMVLSAASMGGNAGEGAKAKAKTSEGLFKRLRGGQARGAEPISSWRIFAAVCYSGWLHAIAGLRSPHNVQPRSRCRRLKGGSQKGMAYPVAWAAVYLQHPMPEIPTCDALMAGCLHQYPVQWSV